MKRIILAVAMLSLSTAACGKTAVNPPLVIDGAEHNLSPVVRVEWVESRFSRSGWRGRCAGVLVAERIALTAAHCVDGRGGKIYIGPENIEIIAFDGQRTDVTRIVINPDHKQKLGTLDNIKFSEDWAVLFLDKPFSAQYNFSKPLYAAENRYGPALKGPFIQAGFSKDARIRNVYPKCSRVNAYDEVLEISCNTASGDSGGPVFAIVDGELRVVAIHSGYKKDKITGFSVLLGSEIRQHIEGAGLVP